MKIGIQGGRGSFNEEACAHFIDKRKITDAEVVYCYSTEGVLSALEEEEIDRGVFAVYNSTSRLVDETSAVMGHHYYSVVAYATIPVRHCLMTLPGIAIADVEMIMAHTEALFQCKKSLKERFGQIRVEGGEDDLIDGAAIAAALASGKLPSRVAVVGSRAIAAAFDLAIIAEELHDDPHNTTTFLFVEKYTK